MATLKCSIVTKTQSNGWRHMAHDSNNNEFNEETYFTHFKGANSSVKQVCLYGLL